MDSEHGVVSDAVGWQGQDEVPGRGDKGGYTPHHKGGWGCSVVVKWIENLQCQHAVELCIVEVNVSNKVCCAEWVRERKQQHDLAIPYMEARKQFWHQVQEWAEILQAAKEAKKATVANVQDDPNNEGKTEKML
jgi:hypothetical protein